MKYVILFSVILLAGLSLASAYTPEQQTAWEGMSLSFQLGRAYQQALMGQNIAGFNALVDQYNAFIRTNFGEDPNMLMPKMDSASTGIPNLINQRNPFNASSDLSQWGKQQVYAQQPTDSNKWLREEDMARSTLENF